MKWVNNNNNNDTIASFVCACVFSERLTIKSWHMHEWNH